MTGKSIRNGISFLHQKPGLVILIYSFNLLAAYVVALPLKTALTDLLAPKGFGADLAVETDIVVWTDLIQELNYVFDGIFSQIVWMLPLLFIGKVASSVGLINALRDGGIRSFWPGVGYYTGRGLLLGLLFLVVSIVAIVASIVFFILLYGVFSGEAGRWWVSIAVIPAILITVFAFLDMVHDYARIKLVKDEPGVFKCFLEGFRWPFAHRSALPIYAFWFLAATVTVILPSCIDASMAATTTGGVWALFLIQQIVILVRAALTVAWFGSEVYFFEQVEWGLTPLIAKTRDVDRDQASSALSLDKSLDDI